MNKMSRPYRLLGLLFASLLALTGCASAARTPPLLLTPTPDRSPITPPSQGVIVSAVVVPARVARLSFPIGGKVRQVNATEGQRVQQGQILAALDVPELEYALVEAEAALRAAEAEYRYWRYPRNRPPERRELAQAEVLRAQTALQAAQAALAQAVITAPFAGTVTAIEVVPGAVIQPAETVLVLADLGHLRLETTDLSERQVERVKIGDEANIVIETLGLTLTGRVVAIAPRAETIGGDVIFKVTIEPKEQIEGLRWGMRGEVEILTK